MYSAEVTRVELCKSVSLIYCNTRGWATLRENEPSASVATYFPSKSRLSSARTTFCPSLLSSKIRYKISFQTPSIPRTTFFRGPRHKIIAEYPFSIRHRFTRFYDVYTSRRLLCIRLSSDCSIVNRRKNGKRKISKTINMYRIFKWMKKNVNYKFFEIFWGARVTVKNCTGKIATGKKWNEKVEKECKDDIKKKVLLSRLFFVKS